MGVDWIVESALCCSELYTLGHHQTTSFFIKTGVRFQRRVPGFKEKNSESPRKLRTNTLLMQALLSSMLRLYQSRCAGVRFKQRELTKSSFCWAFNNWLAVRWFRQHWMHRAETKLLEVLKNSEEKKRTNTKLGRCKGYRQHHIIEAHFRPLLCFMNMINKPHFEHILNVLPLC